ncbi:hypothetical protein [Bacillus bombysepticus]|uniref:hypothetical protein n=1 Tax=Bacillus bombysepticus TaxID=658666 RepID=UPI0030173D8D
MNIVMPSGVNSVYSKIQQSSLFENGVQEPTLDVDFIDIFSTVSEDTVGADIVLKEEKNEHEKEGCEELKTEKTQTDNGNIPVVNIPLFGNDESFKLPNESRDKAVINDVKDLSKQGEVVPENIEIEENGHKKVDNSLFEKNSSERWENNLSTLLRSVYTKSRVEKLYENKEDYLNTNKIEFEFDKHEISKEEIGLKDFNYNKGSDNETAGNKFETKGLLEKGEGSKSEHVDNGKFASSQNLDMNLRSTNEVNLKGDQIDLGKEISKSLKEFVDVQFVNKENMEVAIKTKEWGEVQIKIHQTGQGTHVTLNSENNQEKLDQVIDLMQEEWKEKEIVIERQRETDSQNKEQHGKERNDYYRLQTEEKDDENNEEFNLDKYENEVSN